MTPAHEAIVAAQTIQGVPSRAIAAQIGTSHTSVERARNRPSVRAYIESEITELMKRGLKPARQTLCRQAAMGNGKRYDPETKRELWDKDVASIAQKASAIILQHANPQPGTVIYNLTQINQTEVPEVIRALFAQVAHNDTRNVSMLDRDTIDIGQSGVDAGRDRP